MGMMQHNDMAFAFLSSHHSYRIWSVLQLEVFNTIAGLPPL